MPVGAGAHAVGVDLGDRQGHGRGGPTAAVAGPTGSSRSSTRVFHASQPAQRPAHFGAAPPHSVHR